MNKLEKLVNWIFFLAILLLMPAAVSIVFGDVLVPREIAVKKVPIKERITLRIVEEIGNDTAIQIKIKEGTETDTSIGEKKEKIIEEEIQNDVVKIPVVKIEVITIEMIRPEIIRTIIVGLDKIQIEELTIKIYDVSYQARRLRKEINYAIANDNFKKYLQEGNMAMVQNCLQTAGVDSQVIETLITGLGKEVPKLTVQGFGEYVWNENAYIVEDYDREVKQNDLVIFDITKQSNLLRAIEFVQKNKDKLDAVIIGWGNDSANNFDELDFSKYPAIMKNHEHFFSTCKAIAPTLPVGLCITYRENTMYQWLLACDFSYNFLAIFNITKMRANFKKIQERFPNQKLMIGGMNAGENAEYGGTAYKNYIEKLKTLKFLGSIFHK